MDLFLLFFAIVAIVVFLIINLKMVLYYEEDSGDSSESSFIRGVVIAAWTLAYVVIFLLPIDVRNSRQQGGLDMESFWGIAVTTVMLFVGFLLPAAIFFVETKGDSAVFEKGSAGRRTLGQMLFFAFFLMAFLLISFAVFSTAKLPVVDVACGSWIDADAVIESQHVCQSPVDRFLEISVRFDIYVMGVFCFIGWWLFVVFGGIGLTALPMDLAYEYLDRPKPIRIEVYASKKIMYAQTAEALLNRAAGLQERDEKLKDKTGWSARRDIRALKTDFNKFKQSVILLENEVSHMELCKAQRGENPLVSAMRMVAAGILGLASLFWVLHIFLYLLMTEPGDSDQPSATFLNGILMGFEEAGLFVLAAVLFSLLNMHLLFCTVKGCLKVGMRAFCLPIHPMRKGQTPLNSLLFNCILILFTSCAIVQFSQLAFRDYARATRADVVFNAQIAYLKFYNFFFAKKVFLYLLVSWCFVALIYLTFNPKDRPAMTIGSEKSDKEMRKLTQKYGKEGDQNRS